MAGFQPHLGTQHRSELRPQLFPETPDTRARTQTLGWASCQWFSMPADSHPALEKSSGHSQSPQEA